MYDEAVLVLRSMDIADVVRSRPEATRKLIEFTQTAVPALGRAALGEEPLSAEDFFHRACSAEVSTEAPKLSLELRAAVRFVCAKGDKIVAWRAQRKPLAPQKAKPAPLHGAGLPQACPRRARPLSPPIRTF